MMWDTVKVLPELIHSEKKSSPVCPSLCEWEWCIKWYLIECCKLLNWYSYLIHNTPCMHDAYTHCHNSHISQSWVVDLQFLYSNFDTIYSPPDSSVCGRALYRRDCHPVLFGQWNERKETEGDTALRVEDEQPKRTPLTHLPINLSFPGRWSH